MKSERLEIRVSPEFLVRLDGARGDVTRTRFVERALEKALGDGPASPSVAAVTSKPSRASVRPFRCPVARCQFEAGSAAATCGMHGRKVVPV